RSYWLTSYTSPVLLDNTMTMLATQLYQHYTSTIPALTSIISALYQHEPVKTSLDQHGIHAGLCWIFQQGVHSIYQLILLLTIVQSVCIFICRFL
ncbi:MAG: hypothetical protein ACRCT3_11595, partial [Aeromonas hydrophila]